jgi:hypothetical protein
VCRVVPAALQWFQDQKTVDPEFYMPAGIVDAVLTQVLYYSQEFDDRGLLLPFCEFVYENRDEFFTAVYNDKKPNMNPLFCQISLK